AKPVRRRLPSIRRVARRRHVRAPRGWRQLHPLRPLRWREVRTRPERRARVTRDRRAAELRHGNAPRHGHARQLGGPRPAARHRSRSLKTRQDARVARIAAPWLRSTAGAILAVFVTFSAERATFGP